MFLPAIKQISVYRHMLHFKQPAGTSRGVYLTRKLWLVALESENFTAVGECAPLPDLSCDAMSDEQYERHLVDFCSLFMTMIKDKEASVNLGSVQEPIVENSGLQQELHVENSRLLKDSHAGHLRVDNLNLIHQVQDLHKLLPAELAIKMQGYPSMLFALESAVLQLHSQSLIFAHSPFACENTGIPINGLIWMGDFQQMFKRLQAKMEQGFRCIKLKIGAIDFNQELSLLQHIREHFSPEQIEIRVDANGAFKVEEASHKLEQLAAFNLHSIEQPIKAGQWDSMRKLCDSTPLPIALDEELIGVNEREQKIKLLETIRPQYIILKPSLHGGLSGALEWIELAQERGIGNWITSALESNIGLSVIAQFAGLLQPTMPQGLGTGQLFTDNIDFPLSIHKDALYLDHKSALENPPQILSYLKQHNAQCVAVIK